MAAAVAERVMPSKRQSRKRRRQRFADRAKAMEESPDYLQLKSCGWDVRSREMRRREPPTRSTNGKVSRLNKSNAWYQPGDAKVLVQPEESATWSWWSSLDTDEQDEVTDLSRRVSGQGDGLSRSEPDPLEMLKEMADLSDEVKATRYVAIGREDPRAWGRVKR